MKLLAFVPRDLVNLEGRSITIDGADDGFVLYPLTLTSQNGMNRMGKVLVSLDMLSWVHQYKPYILATATAGWKFLAG